MAASFLSCSAHTHEHARTHEHTHARRAHARTRTHTRIQLIQQNNDTYRRIGDVQKDSAAIRSGDNDFVGQSVGWGRSRAFERDDVIKRAHVSRKRERERESARSRLLDRLQATGRAAGYWTGRFEGYWTGCFEGVQKGREGNHQLSQRPRADFSVGRGFMISTGWHQSIFCLLCRRGTCETATSSYRDGDVIKSSTLPAFSISA